MLKNGVALPLEPAFTEASTDKPATEIEIAIGKTVAQAAILVCAALERHQEGKSTPAINMQGAELIAKLYTLQQSAPDIDFTAIATREGRHALRRALAQNIGAAEALCQRCSLDEVLDMIISWPLGALAQVTADEQTWINVRRN